MNVVFLLRRDALAKPGGDSSKVKRYLEHLRERGIEASIVTDREVLPALNPDIVHLVNLDLPAENLANARAARAVKAKIVLSTIRHPFGGVQDFYHHGDDRLYRKLRRAGVPSTRGIGFRELVKLGMARDRAALHAVRNYVQIQQELLSTSDVVLPMAKGELASLRRDFSFDAETRVVENALSFTLDPNDVERVSQEFDVITVGRVEPRKNSLALARLACRAPHRSVAFAGQLNHRHPAYVREFLRIVETTENVHYLGVLPPDEVKRSLRRSRVYVNPAWFEVVSQADFEALSVGLPLLTTTQSYIGDSIEGGGWLSPRDFNMLANGDGDLDAIIELAAPATLTASRRDWSQAADELVEVYRTLA